MSEYCKNCEKLINKINRCEEELNQIKLLLEGKNTQYEQKTKECEELRNKLQIATEALEIIANQNFKYTSENICNLAQNEQIPCSNNCKYCFQQYAQHALEQIEGILNEK